MHRFGKGKNVASVLKYHGKMWYNFAVPHFAVPNFAPAKSPPPPRPVDLVPSASSFESTFRTHSNVSLHVCA